MASKRKSPPLKVVGEDFLFPTKRQNMAERFRFPSFEHELKHDSAVDHEDGDFTKIR